MIQTFLLFAGLAFVVAGASARADGDSGRGAVAYRACVACHALEPGVHRTGPSLAGIWGRKAGSIVDFKRYSEQLKHATLVWNEANLDAWLRNPQAVVPGNYMTFRGVADAGQRADLVAFLRTASEEKAGPKVPRAALPDLKEAPTSARIASLRRCGDGYFLTNGEGVTRPFWEFNLRFKTDSSPSGPRPGAPILVSQGMQGDRAQVVFAAPAEISTFIREGC